MKDIEMTRACALAMGLEVREVPDNEPRHTIRFVAMSRPQNYWPLTDDAQAMALVKRFRLDIAFTGEWMVMTDSRNKVRGDDLNRCICECVANLGIASDSERGEGES